MCSVAVEGCCQLPNQPFTPFPSFSSHNRFLSFVGVLKECLAKCVAGESVINICEFGDNLIVEETGKVFKKEKDTKKGIAFPTCVSVNNCVCHFSPLKSDKDVVLKDGDLVKMYASGNYRSISAF